MDNTIRIKANPLSGEQYLKIQLDQDYDLLEILSLKLTQDQIYKRHCADYGVIAGRVIINGAVGVPNAKISVFIPIDVDDSKDPLISAMYPYGSTSDTNAEGIKYNLLGESPRQDDLCHRSVGTFPDKRRVLDCDTWCEVYGKYYKYTTSTNNAGDYMIVGVPLGIHTVHMDVDLGDIGYLSQKPFEMIAQGYPEKSFDSYNQFKESNNLNLLTHIKSQDKSINVQPFWGDVDNCTVGINRVDFLLDYEIKPIALFMGSIFGDSNKDSINKNCIVRKKMGKLDRQITGPGTIEMIRKNYFGDTEPFNINGGQNIDDDGTWVMQIPMNLDNMITNEFGDMVKSADPRVGIPTKGKYRFRIGLQDGSSAGRLRKRAHFLVPNYFGDYEFSRQTKDTQSFPGNSNLVKNNFVELEWNGIYTVKQFIPRISNTPRWTSIMNFIGIKDTEESGANLPFPYNRADVDLNPLFTILCFILTTIIAFIVKIINQIVIGAINLIMGIIKKFSSKTKLVSCLTIKCQAEDDALYCPGCNPDTAEGVNDPKCCSGDVDGTCFINGNAYTNYRDCVQISLAQALNLYTYYFTNDWINGTLYAPLFKIKQKNGGRNKFCRDGGNYIPRGLNDYRCDIGPSSFVSNNVLGVVGSNNFQAPKDWLRTTKGLIAEYDDHFYYTPNLYNSSSLRLLFATDIYNLGSIKKCDFTNKPFLINNIPATTFNTPDDVPLLNGDGSPMEPGVEGLFFDISCTQIKLSSSRCRNIERICELDIDLNSDDIINSGDITDVSILDIRKKLMCLNEFYACPNTCGMAPCTLNVNNELIDSLGNILSQQDIDQLLQSWNLDAKPWLIYRFGNVYDNTGLLNPNGAQCNMPAVITRESYLYNNNNSLYFYFGTIPGASAIDKYQSKYGAFCDRLEPCNIIISGTVINNECVDGSTGEIYVSANGGTPLVGGNYIYSWEYANDGGEFSGLTATVTATTSNLIGLSPDYEYRVTVRDVVNNVCKKKFNIAYAEPFTVSVGYSEYICGTNLSSGYLNVFVSGGRSPYNTNITYVDALSNVSQSAFTGSVISIQSAQPGVYVISSSDSAITCPSTTGTTVEIKLDTGFSISARTESNFCDKYLSGQITAGVINGGAPPFLYELTYNQASSPYYVSALTYDYNSVVFTQLSGDTNPTPSNTCAELTYRLTVTDGCGYIGTIYPRISNVPLTQLSNLSANILRNPRIDVSSIHRTALNNAGITLTYTGGIKLFVTTTSTYVDVTNVFTYFKMNVPTTIYDAGDLYQTYDYVSTYSITISQSAEWDYTNGQEPNKNILLSSTCGENSSNFQPYFIDVNGDRKNGSTVSPFNGTGGNVGIPINTLLIDGYAGVNASDDILIENPNDPTQPNYWYTLPPVSTITGSSNNSTLSFSDAAMRDEIYSMTIGGSPVNPVSGITDVLLAIKGGTSFSVNTTTPVGYRDYLLRIRRTNSGHTLRLNFLVTTGTTSDIGIAIEGIGVHGESVCQDAQVMISAVKMPVDTLPIPSLNRNCLFSIESIYCGTLIDVFNVPVTPLSPSTGVINTGSGNIVLPPSA